jgi:prepilin-type N-terminal cleavage/methylation domain-containing protein
MIIRSNPSGGPTATQGPRRAFTLAEVLVAVAISGIVFAATYAGISNCYNIMQTSRANLRATQIMVSELEGIRLCAWQTSTNGGSQLFSTSIVPTGFTNYFYPLGLNGSTNMGLPFYGTVGVVQLTNSAEQSNIFGGTIPFYCTNMALVTVTVKWTNGLGAKQMAHSRHMSTFVAEYGVQNYIISH